MHTIEKKAMCSDRYPISVGAIGYTELAANKIPGLLAHPDFKGKGADKLLVIESFYNYLATGSINNRRAYFKGLKVEGIGAVLLKKLAKLVKKGSNSVLGISKSHDYIYVTGAKKQAWDSYLRYGFRPIGSNAMTWRVNTDHLLGLVGKAKVVVKKMEPRPKNRPRKIPSLFSQTLNSLTKEPTRTPLKKPQEGYENAWNTDDPIDATLTDGVDDKLVLGGIVSSDGFVVK